MSDGWGRLVSAVVVAAAAFGLFLVAEHLFRRVMRRLGRRSAVLAELTVHAHRPFLWFAGVVAVRSACTFGLLDGPWRGPVSHGLGLALIGVAAWLVAGVLTSIERAACAAARTTPGTTPTSR